jgi:hypothetical protein
MPRALLLPGALCDGTEQSEDTPSPDGPYRLEAPLQSDTPWPSSTETIC